MGLQTYLVSMIPIVGYVAMKLSERLHGCMGGDLPEVACQGFRLLQQELFKNEKK